MLGMGLYIWAWVILGVGLMRLVTAHHADQPWAQGLSNLI